MPADNHSQHGHVSYCIDESLDRQSGQDYLEVVQPEVCYKVGFGGLLKHEKDADGTERCIWQPDVIVKA